MGCKCTINYTIIPLHPLALRFVPYVGAYRSSPSLLPSALPCGPSLQMILHPLGFSSGYGSNCLYTVSILYTVPLNVNGAAGCGARRRSSQFSSGILIAIGTDHFLLQVEAACAQAHTFL